MSLVASRRGVIKAIKMGASGIAGPPNRWEEELMNGCTGHSVVKKRAKGSGSGTNLKTGNGSVWHGHWAWEQELVYGSWEHLRVAPYLHLSFSFTILLLTHFASSFFFLPPSLHIMLSSLAL